MDPNENAAPEWKVNPKKRQKYGRVSDASKKMRNHTHETGKNCECSRLKCFDKINESERLIIIKHFNGLPDRNAQNLHLSGLVKVHFIKQRRSRKDQAESDLHNHSYTYKVRVKRGEVLHEESVCYKAFIALHGITPRRLHTIQQQLTLYGMVRPDGRGKHDNRHHSISNETRLKVNEHIQSLKGRRSHYSLKKTSKIYLPEELSAKRLHKMYMELNPNNPISYDSYLRIFNSEYNISFGYPRTDTCSECDSIKAQEKQLHEELSLLTEADDPSLVSQKTNLLKNLAIRKELHLRRAQTFYDRKLKCRQMCSKSDTEEAIAMDFQKNLSVPNISSNIVYYKRQLTVHLFNIHVLTSGDSVFYCYDQTFAKKGSDEVVSMLHHYIFNILPSKVKQLHIFCDSCGGQNKNYTVFRYIHYVVTKCHRLDKITMTFPERGHSYLECDKNMALIPQKRITEVPQDWYTVIRDCRVKPNPFKVIECDQTLFKEWTNFFSLRNLYKPKLSIPSRPLKEVKTEIEQPRLLSLRSGSYNGPWETTVMTMKRKPTEDKLADGEFMLPGPAYSDFIPVPLLKWKDLQEISKLLSSEKSKNYYKNLPH